MAITTGLVMGSAMLMSLSAHASTGLLAVKESTHKVTFSRTDTETAEGLATIYKKLQSKTRRVCAVGQAIDAAGHPLSRQDCASDLLTQFIESADIPELKAFHLSQIANTKTLTLVTN